MNKRVVPPESWDLLVTAKAFRRGGRMRSALIRAGAKLREARIAKGLTQAELGKIAGLAQADVSRLEAGVARNGPELGSLLRFAWACNCELNLEITPRGKTSSSSTRGLTPRTPLKVVNS